MADGKTVHEAKFASALDADGPTVIVVRTQPQMARLG
jgi:hypothetical protein